MKNTLSVIRTLSRAALAGCAGCLLTFLIHAPAAAYEVVPGHEYRIDLEVVNFHGSVIGMGEVIFEAVEIPPFVTDFHPIVGDVLPGETGVLGIEFRILPGSWGQADTLRVAMSANTGSFSLQPPGWEPAFFLQVVGECQVNCAGDPEGEPLLHGEDETNGGCYSEPPVFTFIDCGQTYCGSAFTWSEGVQEYRDTDWYYHSPFENSRFTWEVEAEFPLTAMVMDGSYSCPAYALLAVVDADSCQPALIQTDCLPEGEYYFYASPRDSSGLPEERNYTATLSCEPCDWIDPCELAEVIACNTVLYDDNGSGTRSWAGYPHCAGDFQTGPEKVYTLVIPLGGTRLVAGLSGLDEDLDIFLQQGCDYGSCIAAAEDTLDLVLDQGQYSLVVDGYLGAESSYTLAVNCFFPQPPAPLLSIRRLNDLDVELGWSAEAPGDSFRVYRSTEAFFDPQPGDLVAVTADSTWVDAGALQGYAAVYYRIRAFRTDPPLESGDVVNLRKRGAEAIGR